MNPEGGLVFDVHWDGRTVSEVKLSSVRPLQLVQLLRGKTVTEGLRLLGMLYRICGVAQRYAGLRAWQQASDVEVVTAVQQAQQLLVKLESLREHLWQVLVAWPQLLGKKPEQNENLLLLSSMLPEAEQALFADGQSMTPAARLDMKNQSFEVLLQQLQQLIEQHICGMRIEQWLAMNSMVELLAWSEENSGPAAQMIAYISEHEYSSLGSNEKDICGLPLLAEEKLLENFGSDAREQFVA
ncbi:MAG: hypothetical protein R3240_13120, partial [Gammaproteobacteria bacterium]|nr:hypothetical protein [Gammaproteobacteria bacterium]